MRQRSYANCALLQPLCGTMRLKNASPVLKVSLCGTQAKKSVNNASFPILFGMKLLDCVKLAPNNTHFGTIQSCNANSVGSQLQYGMEKRKSVKAVIALIPIGTLQHNSANNAKTHDQFGMQL